VACTSMLWEGKGQHVLLKAVGRARSTGMALELELAGAGEPGYEAYLRELAQEPDLSGAVRFHGLLDLAGVSALLSRAHVFALPSVWGEPFGLATAEAMAHGACVVGSDSGATPELVQDGATGLVATAGDPERWFDALVRLGRDEEERRRLAAAGREHARAAFDHERFMEALEAELLRAAEAFA
jgi:glycosyltransferase involved in cell wall biosynthesis